MAEIRGLEEQRKALDEIKQLLKKIESVNHFLENMSARSSEFTVSYQVTDEAGKSIRYQSLFPSSSGEMVRKYVLEVKTSYVKRIELLAESYRIQLDSNDERIINMFAEEIY